MVPFHSGSSNYELFGTVASFVQGIEAVGGVAMVEVPHFDRKELDHCLDYYQQEKWFNKRMYIHCVSSSVAALCPSRWPD